MRLSVPLRIISCLVLSVPSTALADNSPKQTRRQLTIQKSSTVVSLKSTAENSKPAYLAVFRIHSSKITYSRMFDGLVPDEYRDRMFFKGMHLFYPSHRVAHPLAEVVLKRRSELPSIRLPENLRGAARPLVPRQPPIRLTEQQRALAKQIEAFETAALAMLSTPIVAVWGLRTDDGSPDDYLVLYANGRANDAGGKLSWDWRDGAITVNFPGEKCRLAVAAAGRSLSGKWVGGAKAVGRLLGYTKVRAMPALATWHMKNATGIVSTIKLYANGCVNDQHAKATWSWSDAKLSVSVDGNTAAEFKVDSAGSQLKGRWEDQDGIVADLHNAVVAFVPAEPTKRKPDDPKLWASLNRKTTDYFKLLVSHVPEEQRPPQDVIAFFTKDANDANFQIIPISETDVEFRIVAATVAQAEARARGLLAIYDHGVIASAQQFLQHRMKLLQDELKSREADVAKLEQELADDLRNPTKLAAARSRLERPKYLVRKSGNIIGAHGHVIRKYVRFQVVDHRIVVASVKWEANGRSN